MVLGYGEDMSGQQIKQVEGSLKKQNEAMDQKIATEKAEDSSKGPTGEKPNLLRRMWAKVAGGGSEKYRADMEAYFDKKWEEKNTEVTKEVEALVGDTERHTEQSIVDLEYDIITLVKAGELDPAVGDKLTVKLEQLRIEAQKAAAETTKEVEKETGGQEQSDKERKIAEFKAKNPGATDVIEGNKRYISNADGSAGMVLDLDQTTEATKKVSESEMAQPTNEDSAELKSELSAEDGEILNQIIQLKNLSERQSFVRKLYEKNAVSQELNDYLSSIEELQPIFAELQGDESVKEGQTDAATTTDRKIEKPTKETSDAKLFKKLSQSDRDLFDLIKEEGGLPNIQKFLATKYKGGEVSPALKNYLATEGAFRKVFETIDNGQEFTTENTSEPQIAEAPSEKSSPAVEAKAETGIDGEVFSKEFSRYIVGMKLQLVDNANKHLTAVDRFRGEDPDFIPNFKQNREKLLQSSARDAWTLASKFLDNLSQPNSEFRKLIKSSKESATEWVEKNIDSNKQARLDLEARMHQRDNSKADLLITSVGRLQIEEAILQQLKESIQHYKTATTEAAPATVSPEVTPDTTVQDTETAPVTTAEEVPATPTETVQPQSTTGEQIAALDALLAKQSGLVSSEKYKSNYFKKTEGEQNKMAWFEVYSELQDNDPIKVQVDANRKGWALVDKQAGKTTDLNDAQDDYRPGTDQFKFQTGESLKQVAEHLRKEVESKLNTQEKTESGDTISKLIDKISKKIDVIEKKMAAGQKITPGEVYDMMYQMDGDLSDEYGRVQEEWRNQHPEMNGKPVPEEARRPEYFKLYKKREEIIHKLPEEVMAPLRTLLKGEKLNTQDSDENEEPEEGPYGTYHPLHEDNIEGTTDGPDLNQTNQGSSVSRAEAAGSKKAESDEQRDADTETIQRLSRQEGENFESFKNRIDLAVKKGEINNSVDLGKLFDGIVSSTFVKTEKPQALKHIIDSLITNGHRSVAEQFVRLNKHKQFGLETAGALADSASTDGGKEQKLDDAA